MTLRARLAAQAIRTPDAIAVEDGSSALSFARLRSRADALARVLAARGAGRECAVAVRAARTVDLVVALAAVVQAGAAFVPVDPAHPADRQRFIVRDSRAGLLLSDTGAAPPGGPPLVGIGERLPPGARPVRLPAIHPEQAAYVLYTSGSTGVPKGVVVPHRALLRYLDWAAARYGCAGPAPVPTSPAFDLTLTALFVPLLAGRTVRLVPGDDLTALAALLAGRAWGLLKLTPSHLAALEALWAARPGSRPALGTLVAGGEALHRSQVRRWLGSGQHTAVFNEYGPTEATVGCCVHRAAAGGPEEVPIGVPVPYASAALLHGGQAVAGPGRGELLIGGTALARGYLGQPALTADRFVPDPAAPGARRYRTGDLVSRDASGLLHYHGRLDRQLKIRGHRVEPGEVESALRSAPGVGDAAVRGEQAAGRTRLAGYVVPRDRAGFSVAALRSYLAGRLPGYLIPSRIVLLPALPLTSAGKVDYARLNDASAAMAAALARLEALPGEPANDLPEAAPGRPGPRARRGGRPAGGLAADRLAP
jgi:nonribosomal peptide synthetase protein BlmVI